MEAGFCRSWTHLRLHGRECRYDFVQHSHRLQQNDKAVTEVRDGASFTGPSDCCQYTEYPGPNIL